MKKLFFTSIILLFSIASLVSADPLNDYKNGHERLKAGQLSEALYYLNSVLADPAFILSDYAQYDRGEVYFKNGNFLLAAEEYRKISSESVLYPEALYKSAESHKRAGSLEEAARNYKKYFINFPDEAKAPQAGLELAQIFKQLEDYKAAFLIYNQVDFYYPLSSQAKSSRLMLRKLAKLHRMPAYKAQPKELFKKGSAYLKSGDFNEAEAVFFRLARDYPKSKYIGEAFLMMGRAELSEGKLNLAISNIERSLGYTRQGSKGGNWYYLGRAYGRRGIYVKAMVYMKKVLDYYPQSIYADDACYYLGLYYEYYHSPQAAISTYLYLAEKYPRSNYVDNVLFRTGVLLYKAYDFENAYRVFAASRDKRVGEETPKCLLWWGKLAERLGRPEEAAGVYYYLAERYDHTYASYRAREGLSRLKYRAPKSKPIEKNNLSQALSGINGEEEDDQQELQELMGTWRENQSNLNKDVADNLERYRALVEAGITEYAAWEARKILSAGGARESAQITMGKILQKAGEYRTPIGLTEQKVKDAVLMGKPNLLPYEVWQLAYPLGFFDEVLKFSKQNNLDPYLTLAVIREESRFNPKALSRSRAHGLMQIIPSTGRLIAKDLGLLSFRRRQMYQVDTNLMMGTYYLKNLISSFDGNIALALAGYNGGPGRVRKWVNNWYNGDNRNLDIDEFIEYIPLRETRNYVQKVLGSYYEYKRLYERRSD